MRLRLRGWTKEGLVLVYRTPASCVADLVPEGFELNTHNGDAFWNVAVTQVETLRPWGLPSWAGFDCSMVTCGLNVAAQTAGGKEMRGLSLIRHDADPRFLWFLGKESLGFETHRASIEFVHKKNRLIVTVDSQEDDRGHAYLSVDLERPVPVAPESARLPAYPVILMSVDRWLSRVHFTEMLPDSFFPWKPVHVQESRWNLLRDLDQEQATLESAWRMEPGEFTWAVGLTTDLELRVSLPPGTEAPVSTISY